MALVTQQDGVRLLERYRVPPVDAEPVFNALVAAYSSPDRYYHNLEHLTEMFEVAGRLAPNTDDSTAVQLAIWFHDAVYDPRASDNETRSADLAVDLLSSIGVPGSVIEKVVRLVRATAQLSSSEPPTDRDTATLLDADLAILGSSPARYQRYAADIRKEYAWLPLREYHNGRTAVLKQFLARPRIYYHQLTFQQYEERARLNLTTELQQLDNIVA